MTVVNSLSNKNGSVYDLIIIRLGPAGCNAAIVMAEAGLKVAAVKREVEVFILPHSLAIQP